MALVCRLHGAWMALLVALASGARSQTPPPRDTATAESRRVFAVARKDAAWVFAHAADSLHPRLSGGFRSRVPTPGQLAAMLLVVPQPAGQGLGQPGRERLFHEQGFWSYYRVGPVASEAGGQAMLRLVIGAADSIYGIQITPLPEIPASPNDDYQTRTPLRLPFAAPPAGGSWYVAWGGRTPEENKHIGARDQRFAYDLLVVDSATVVSRGAGASNEDHRCFGVAILAPAAGTVTEAVDEVVDNTPGAVNSVAPAGNHVVIDHGNGEYSLLAHLRQGSVSVKTGERVAAGQPIGQCGNSGQSTLPHLHYHLQTTPHFGDGGAGLPATFRDLTVDGRRVERAQPVRGQRVGN